MHSPPSQRAAGVALSLASSASNQTGAAIGALAFGGVGVTGVVAVRQVTAAIALCAIARPRWRAMDRRSLLLVLALAVVVGTMNLTLYAAVDRIGLGLAVTLEFLGPLAVAVGTSRRLVDGLAAVVAAVGVVVLVSPGPSSDLAGIALALLAAAMWASYILLNRALGTHLPGVRAASAAGLVLAVAWGAPVLVVTLLARPALQDLLLAAVCGVMASAVPYAVDLLALRRLPASLFATLMSTNPLWAFAAGALVLGERIALHEVVGAALVIVGNAVATAASSLQRGGTPQRPARWAQRWGQRWAGGRSR